MILADLTNHSIELLAQLPNAGKGAQPPGTGGISKIVSWAAWLGLVVCIIGVIVSGAMMAVAHRRGEGGEHMARLGSVFVGAIVIGAATGLVNAVV